MKDSLFLLTRSWIDEKIVALLEAGLMTEVLSLYMKFVHYLFQLLKKPLQIYSSLTSSMLLVIYFRQFMSNKSG